MNRLQQLIKFIQDHQAKAKTVGDNRLLVLNEYAAEGRIVATEWIEIPATLWAVKNWLGY